MIITATEPATKTPITPEDSAALGEQIVSTFAMTKVTCMGVLALLGSVDTEHHYYEYALGDIAERFITDEGQRRDALALAARIGTLSDTARLDAAVRIQLLAIESRVAAYLDGQDLDAIWPSLGVSAGVALRDAAVVEVVTLWVEA